MRSIYGELHEGSDRLIGRNNQIDYQMNGSIRWTGMATVMKNEPTTSLTEQLQQHQECLLMTARRLAQFEDSDEMSS